MIFGPIDQLADALLIWQDESRGRYYCQCDLVRGEDHCCHHGDPIERYGKSEKPDEHP